MKEKLLINEINRIGQIMGQNHSAIIIIESLSSKTPKVSEIAEKIKFFKAESELVKTVERFIGKSSKSFEERLENWIYKNMTSQDGIRAIKAMIKDASEASENYAQTFLDDYIEVFDRLYTYYGDDLEKTINTIKHNYGNNVGNLFRKYRLNIGGLVDNAERISKNNTLKSLMSSLMKSLNKQDIETIVRVYRRIFKKPEKLQAEFNKLANDAKIKLNSNPPIRIDYELKKMGDVLASAKKWWDTSAETLYTQWVNDPSFPASIRKKMDLMSDENKFQYVFKELKKEKDILDPMASEWEAYKKLWPFKLPDFLGGDKKGWGIFKRATPEDKVLQRWGNLIVYKDPRLISEWRNALLATGATSDFIRNMFTRMVADAFILPAMYAIAGLGIRPIIAGGEFAWNSMPWTDGDSNWIDYNELKKTNAGEIMKEDFKKCLKDTMPEGVWEWMMSFIDPSYLDELYENVIKPLVSLKGTHSEDKLKKEGEDLVKKEMEKNKQKLKTFPCYDEKLSFDENLKAIKDCAEAAAKKKTEEVVDDTTEAGLILLFKTKMGLYGFTVKRDFDGMSGITNETDSNTGFDTWYWDKGSKKFIPYAKSN